LKFGIHSSETQTLKKYQSVGIGVSQLRGRAMWADKETYKEGASWLVLGSLRGTILFLLVERLQTEIKNSYQNNLECL
jgi:hypothetical protein